MNARRWISCWVSLLAVLRAAVGAEPAASLRLVPFPKEVRLEQGRFAPAGPLVLQADATRDRLLVDQLRAELKRAGLPAPEIRPLPQPALALRLTQKPAAPLRAASFRSEAGAEDYWLSVEPQSITVVGRGPAGLFYGVQTLGQLLRANRTRACVPCLTIRDWPSLRWRAFMDDMTRGPSATLATLQREATLGAELKMNLFTYYMEYQYAFAKHPEIGPPDGSLQPDELRRLVACCKPMGMDVLGCQQSFGHFGRILALEKFAGLRENDAVLSPVREETYRLLDDLYSEVVPLVPFEMFNVCCDETWGLGTGPSKELADRIGVGGVYVRHLRRVHDLLAQRYGKRMMMWGDIILKHPDHLAEIPKDTVMLTWGYSARPSFEEQIIPFAGAGYEFFVCPGVSDWSRILPDFAVATTNIRNFVRDGAKHGALGMINTEWKDDGESLRSPNWHGYAWGAECAWNASATDPADFNRRLGAVLFGEPGDHFGRAIDLLAQTHALAGMGKMFNRRFWELAFVPTRSPAAIHTSAARLLELVRPAIAALEACRRDATRNADLLDGLLLGARRMERIAVRELDALEACRLYAEAWQRPPADARPLLVEVREIVARNRDAHEALGQEFERLWRSESKPYALDWTMKRYQAAKEGYDQLLARLAQLRQDLEAGRRLPAPEDVGLAPGALNARRTRPHAMLDTPLAPQAPWEVAASHRLGVAVEPGAADRFDLPVELDVAVPEALVARPVRAFCALGDQPAREVLAQLDRRDGSALARLTLVLAGPLPKRAAAHVRVYLGLKEPAPAMRAAVSTCDGAHGMRWIENDKIRCLLGAEGAHLYRWEVKSLGGRDLTMPGERGWAGFADIGTLRDAPYKLNCTARGPALVRYECVTGDGQTKTISVFGGTSWAEIVLSDPVERYWDFDNPQNFAADGPTPGEYLFSTGAHGRVARQADGVSGQAKAARAHWGIKWNADRLALGLVTPETAANHVIAPGAGAGGVGIERSPPAAHFATLAGLLDADARETMARLQRTLDYRNPPRITIHAIESR